MRPDSRPRVRRGEGNVYRFRVTLDDVTPQVWRRIEVSARASLQELHDVIQVAFGHDEIGGHQFELDGVRYHAPGDEPPVGTTTDGVPLNGLGLYLGALLRHGVDTHDAPWRHQVILEQVSPRLVGQRLPACLDGEGATPPGDIGGPAQYQGMLDALESPHDARAAAMRDWLPGDFDPDFANLSAINAELAKIPMQRP